MRKSQHEGAERDREADEKRWRERNRQRERERKGAEKKEREWEKKEREREKEERERERESDRIQEKLELKVQKLQLQLQLERSRISGPGASESVVQDLIYYLRDQREQENQRRWIEKRADPFAQLLQCVFEYADARAQLTNELHHHFLNLASLHCVVTDMAEIASRWRPGLGRKPARVL